MVLGIWPSLQWSTVSNPRLASHSRRAISDSSLLWYLISSSTNGRFARAKWSSLWKFHKILLKSLKTTKNFQMSQWNQVRKHIQQPWIRPYCLLGGRSWKSACTWQPMRLTRRPRKTSNYLKKTFTMKSWMMMLMRHAWLSGQDSSTLTSTLAKYRSTHWSNSPPKVDSPISVPWKTC